jgi:general secretion pathway protein E
VGLSFARALKAFLRLDPDIIILGEVRDADTARNAVQAAETGHLVFATLHASSIKGCVGRLRDLGVPIHELKGILRSVLAQSLLRTTCKKCKGQSRLNPELYQGKDVCNKCLNTGYDGRTIISECHYFETEEEVEHILSGGEIKWTTVLEDAYQKYLDQVTDYDEFIRVFDSQGIAIIKERGSLEDHLAKIQDENLDLTKQDAES